MKRTDAAFKVGLVLVVLVTLTFMYPFLAPCGAAFAASGTCPNADTRTFLGGIVVNENGTATSTRIEGDTDANLGYFDAVNDRVGIGTASPSTKFHVNGASTLGGAVTLGGTVSGGGNQINNVVVGNVSPGAGTFTSLSTDQATFNLINSTATTMNFGGGVTTFNIGGATSATTWTGQSFTFTGANTTNNTTLTVANTSNGATNNQSIVDIQVGGTTSTGDPQLRFTIPGGVQQWLVAPDNSSSGDWLYIGTGTTPGSNTIVRFDGRTTTAGVIGTFIGNQAATIASGSGNVYTPLRVDGQALTYTGTTQVTSLVSAAVLIGQAIAGDTATLTVDKATATEVRLPGVGANVSLTNNAGIRVVSGGGGVNNYGVHVEAMTAGSTLNAGVFTASGVMIGSESTGNLFDDSSTGSTSTTMYIGNASIDVTVSDGRLKNVIGPTQNALGVINALPVVDYTWKRDRAADLAARPRNGAWVGMIAQDLYELYPQYVRKPIGADQKSALSVTANEKLAAAMVKAAEADTAEADYKASRNTPMADSLLNAALAKREEARKASTEAARAAHLAATADSNWSIDYQYMVPLTIKAIQELSAEVALLKAQLAALPK